MKTGADTRRFDKPATARAHIGNHAEQLSNQGPTVATHIIPNIQPHKTNNLFPVTYNHSNNRLGVGVMLTDWLECLAWGKWYTL